MLSKQDQRTHTFRKTTKSTRKLTRRTPRVHVLAGTTIEEQSQGDSVT